MPKAALAEIPDPRALLVDEYVALAKQAEDFRPTTKRLAELAATMREWIPAKLAGDKDVRFTSRYNQVHFGPCANERTIKSMAAVAQFFGKRFFSMCSFALKHIDSEMDAAERAKYLSESQSGNRLLTAGPRLP